MDELAKKGMTEVDDGVVCCPIPGKVNKEGKPAKFPIKKSDGGFLYATTGPAAPTQPKRWHAGGVGRGCIISLVAR